MNINIIKEKIKLHKYYLITIIIMLIIIIIMGISLLTEENTTFTNPYEVVYESDDNFLFLGDSITDFYPLEEYYDNLPVVNSGISGNKTTDILNDMETRVYQYNPTKVFLLIGTNDLDMTSEDITSLINMQLDDNADWDVFNVQVSGSGYFSSETYSMSGTSIYVMKPYSSQVNKIKKLIDRIQAGDKLSNSDVKGLSGVDEEKDDE